MLRSASAIIVSKFFLKEFLISIISDNRNGTIRITPKTAASSLLYDALSIVVFGSGSFGNKYKLKLIMSDASNAFSKLLSTCLEATRSATARGRSKNWEVRKIDNGPPKRTQYPNTHILNRSVQSHLEITQTKIASKVRSSTPYECPHSSIVCNAPTNAAVMAQNGPNVTKASQTKILPNRKWTPKNMLTCRMLPK